MNGVAGLDLIFFLGDAAWATGLAFAILLLFLRAEERASDVLDNASPSILTGRPDLARVA